MFNVCMCVCAALAGLNSFFCVSTICSRRMSVRPLSAVGRLKKVAGARGMPMRRNCFEIGRHTGTYVHLMAHDKPNMQNACVALGLTTSTS